VPDGPPPTRHPERRRRGGPIIPRHLLLTDGLTVHEAAALKAARDAWLTAHGLPARPWGARYEALVASRRAHGLIDDPRRVLRGEAW
jgi:hypothetical protein